MIRDVLRSIRQLDDPGTRAYVWQSIGAGLVVLALLVVAVALALDAFAVTGFVWLDWTMQIAGTAGAVVVAWFLFPVAVSTTLSFLADQVCAAVERQHYRHLPPSRNQPFVEGLILNLRFTAVALLLNVLALPFYLLPGANIVLFLALNGFLLGREYFDAVALRRHPPHAVARLRRNLRFQTWLAGTLIAAVLLVPLVNLVAPVIGVAFMTHRYHRWTPTAAA